MKIFAKVIDATHRLTLYRAYIYIGSIHLYVYIYTVYTSIHIYIYRKLHKELVHKNIQENNA